MFSMLISIISICLVIMLTVVSVTAGGNGIDFGNVLIFLGGIVLAIGIVIGFLWLLHKAFGGIPSFWAKNTKEISIEKKF